MRGSIQLSDGTEVSVWPDGKKLYAAYYRDGAHHRHDCESVEAENGKPVTLLLSTGRKLVVGEPSKVQLRLSCGAATAPTVERIVCSTSANVHEATGLFFTNQWERHVDPSNAS